MKTKKTLKLLIVDLRDLWAQYFTSLDIENSFNEPRAELRPQLRKWFDKHLSKKLFFIAEFVYGIAAAPIAAKNQR